MTNNQQKLYELFLNKSDETFKKYESCLLRELENVEDEWFIGSQDKMYNIEKVFDALIKSGCANIRDEIRWIGENEDSLDLY